MAGFANTKAKLAECQAENQRLKAQLARYIAEDRPKRRFIVRREYSEQVLEELIEWSEEGMFLDECFAQWGIDAETFEQWKRDHVELAEIVGPSRARAKAAMLRTLREALKSRAAFPVGLADRILAMVERENGAQDDNAERFVRIEFCPRCAAADAASAVPDLQAIEPEAERAT